MGAIPKKRDMCMHTNTNMVTSAQNNRISYPIFSFFNVASFANLMDNYFIAHFWLSKITTAIVWIS